MKITTRKYLREQALKEVNKDLDDPTKPISLEGCSYLTLLHEWYIKEMGVDYARLNKGLYNK